MAYLDYGITGFVCLMKFQGYQTGHGRVLESSLAHFHKTIKPEYHVLPEINANTDTADSIKTFTDGGAIDFGYFFEKSLKKVLSIFPDVFMIVIYYIVILNTTFYMKMLIIKLLYITLTSISSINFRYIYRYRFKNQLRNFQSENSQKFKNKPG